jgi:hypothetical protein
MRPSTVLLWTLPILAGQARGEVLEGQVTTPPRHYDFHPGSEQKRPGPPVASREQFRLTVLGSLLKRSVVVCQGLQEGNNVVHLRIRQTQIAHRRIHILRNLGRSPACSWYVPRIVESYNLTEVHEDAVMEIWSGNGDIPQCWDLEFAHLILQIQDPTQPIVHPVRAGRIELRRQLVKGVVRVLRNPEVIVGEIGEQRWLTVGS